MGINQLVVVSPSLVFTNIYFPSWLLHGNSVFIYSLGIGMMEFSYAEHSSDSTK